MKNIRRIKEMPKETYEISGEGHLGIVTDFVKSVEDKKYIIDQFKKEIIIEDDPFGGHDTGQRIMTIYYKVNINKVKVGE